MRRINIGSLAALGLAGAAISACGLGAGTPTGGLGLTVTDRFGARELVGGKAGKAPGEETAMRQLQRSHRVETRYDGRFVQAIDGLAGGRSAGRPVDWFYFVNGLEAQVGAAEKTLHPGDSVWWDRRDWGAAAHVPAVVGQWPEPFRSGVGGKRLAVRLVCPEAAGEACAEVERRLERAGATPARGIAGVSGQGSGLRVLVGEWRDVRNDPVARSLLQGPAASGVYVQPSEDGRSFGLLDPTGRTVAVLTAGTGLVAATGGSDSPPTWIVSGIGSEGLAGAVAALDTRSLARRYAVVTGPTGVARGAPAIEGAR